MISLDLLILCLSMVRFVLWRILQLLGRGGGGGDWEDGNRKREFWTSELCQEPITRSMQLPYIAVTAFSQADLFLV